MSHFAFFAGFVPDEQAPFEDEFTRLASSQSWVPGSQQYTRQRTIAMREEIKHHYFSQTPDPEQPDPRIQSRGHIAAVESVPKFRQPTTKEETLLRGYQALCYEVGLVQGLDSILECKRSLKATLVNIIDLIDARRNGKKIRVWDWQDFEAFKRYTLQDEKRICLDVAKAGDGILASLLQNFSKGRAASRRRGRRRPVINKPQRDRVASGRIDKV
ncbi:hypothetical protein QBC43DRAFT_320180 [Cladorrhinum sp. PSN259]|nr:hypothetical protein QBC43DRAFT_320180 [Cladorrhinum sp. PSN259]